MNEQPITQGAASRAETPGAAAGTVTFLFSDIEGSTGLLQRLGDRYAGVLEDQRRLLRGAFSAHGGREVDTAGDGFFVAFSRARDALAAAAAAQRALARHAWPEDAAVRVRMGLHTGEPELAGGGYVGLDVHRAARICAAGHGGQVLLSQATRALVDRDLPQGVRLLDLGEHLLKDLGAPERLFQLVLAELPGRFPPLRTLDSRAGNLPRQPTPLVGREQEVETVRGLLLREAVRLVTLTGPGGTGKTRLALEAAAHLTGDFGDGVFFVPLAAVSEPGFVASGIAQALGVPEHAARPVLDDVTDFLRERHLLLVLDNFEQAVAAAPVAAGLLAACPQVKVLVTSRVVLHLSGEYEFPVPPLMIPNPGRLPAVDALPLYPAVALFLERAQAARPGFALTGENAAAVATLCYHLDGLPLAIELAAARVRLFSPQAMLARLGSRFDLLKGGARDRPERHQTLWQAMAWSYDLLEPDEQAFFRRLAVFVGGCTLEAAGRVAGGLGDPVVDTLDAVAALVDKSLLRREEGPEGEPRFVMLETIREYGLECVKQEGEADAVRRAHADYFIALAEQAEPALTGPQQGTWLDRLEAEHDNLRAALEWAEERHEAQRGLRLGAALWRFWIVRGHMREGRERLERLLALPEAREPTKARARALNGLGTIIHEIGEYAAARAWLEQSLSIGRQLEDERVMANVINNLGWVAGMSNDLAAMRALSEEGLALCRRLDDKRGAAVAMANLTWMAYTQGDYTAARARGEESLAIRRAIGDLRGCAFMMSILGIIEQHEGHYERAEALLEEALATLQGLDDRQLIANAIQFQACVAHDQGHYDRALALLEESVSMWREVGNQIGVAEALTFLGSVVLDRGDPERALALLEEAAALWEAVDLKWGLAGARHALGCVAHARGDYERARALCRESLAMRQAIGDRRGLAEGLEAAAALAIVAGQWERAARLLAAAGALREALGVPLPPRSRAGYARDLAAVRAGLDEETFAAAWQAGRALSPEEACTYALAR